MSLWRCYRNAFQTIWCRFKTLGFVIHSTCDYDLGYPVPGMLCSHPQSFPSANFKLSIFARKLPHRKMKKAVDICPARLKLRSLQNKLNSMGDTAVHTESGPWSRKTKCHNWKQLRLSWKRLGQLGGSVNCFTIMVFSSNCVIDHKWYACVY